ESRYMAPSAPQDTPIVPVNLAIGILWPRHGTDLRAIRVRGSMSLRTRVVDLPAGIDALSGALLLDCGNIREGIDGNRARQREREDRSVLHNAFRGDVTAHRARKLPAYGQTEANSSRLIPFRTARGSELLRV